MAGTRSRPVRIDAVVERKHSATPRFLVVPSEAVSTWRLTGTTVVEVWANGIELGRRSLKYWGGDRDCWFIDVTQAHCAKARIDTGDSIELELRLASTALSAELASLLRGDSTAAAAWNALSESRKRQFAEHVRAAKRPQTRSRRAAQLLT